MVDRHCLFFVDNEGAKYALIKGISENDVVDFFVERFAELEMRFYSNIWICRVPSKSNVADEPSRNVPLKLALSNNVDCSDEAKRIPLEVLNDFELGRKASNTPKGK